MAYSTQAGRVRHWLPLGLLSLAFILLGSCKSHMDHFVMMNTKSGTNMLVVLTNSCPKDDDPPPQVTNAITVVTVTNPVSVSVTDTLAIPSNSPIWVVVSNASAGSGSNVLIFNPTVNCSNCGGGGGGNEGEPWGKLLFDFLKDNFKEIIGLIGSLLCIIGGKKSETTGPGESPPTDRGEKRNRKVPRSSISKAFYLIGISLLLWTIVYTFWLSKENPSAPIQPNNPHSQDSAESILTKLDQQQTLLTNIQNAQTQQVELLNDFISTNNPRIIISTGSASGVLTSAITEMQNSLTRQSASLSNQEAQLIEIKQTAARNSGTAPGLFEKTKDRLTIFAIVLGGIWVLLMFRYEALAHTPSLDGDLTIESNRIPDSPLIAVSIRAVWNNRGKFPVRLDKNGCFVRVFKIDHALPIGKFDPDEDDEGWKRIDPYQFPYDRTMEPNTQSIMRAHFILEKNSVYLFRWKITSHSFMEWLPITRWRPLPFQITSNARWMKDIIWDSAENNHVPHG